MELELGLAPPYNNFPTNIKGFDQNDIARFEPKEMNMMRRRDSFGDNFSKMKQKRSFAEAFENGSEGVERKTLSLLIWNGQPNEEEEDNDDGRHGRKKIPFKACDEDSEEENQVVGWPPINTWRQKQFHGNYNQGWWITNERKYVYVKVKMEGVAIGRKVNLRLYDSYQVLAHDLVQMFTKYLNLDDNHSTRFMILYQDKDGDWMLAGDVPWQTFRESVQRIEILRNEK
ncbi:auxin-induced protein IAA6 [Nicotiana tabacum]|uniref:Auxin-responsive protein n=1 Tax=Nicotiana tabacum TaxID=4097 RepID=A0A1S3XQP5_TOBAC|nr:PREDICTED: auxin-responsive protein IAA9-like [Nicotiana tabacum]